MHPPFQSNKSAMVFCALLVLLFLLPILLSWTGPDSTEQAFAGMPDGMGPIGQDAKVMYEDTRDADIVFVGDSRVMWGIREDLVEHALSEHLGRSARVVKLVTNLAGADLQSYILREYLKQHHPALIVWMLPQPVAYANHPHRALYHVARFSQKGAFNGLRLGDRISTYGMMVLGAPQDLLSKFRTNLLGADEKSFAAYAHYVHVDPVHKVGYRGSSFIPDKLPESRPGQSFIQPLTSPVLTVEGPFPQEYQLKYIRTFLAIAQQHGCSVVFLHMPDENEYGDSTIPQLADWGKVIGPNYQMIGVPSAELFSGLTRDQMLHFFSDDVHFNYNGSRDFTDKILAGLIQAYDQAAPHRTEPDSRMTH
jgi:hypothetical protein